VIEGGIFAAIDPADLERFCCDINAIFCNAAWWVEKTLKKDYLCDVVHAADPFGLS
tara:strand:- start:771 stop:938 length:168 start_codon:yes stop_codon:yes gene_type:complete